MLDAIACAANATEKLSADAPARSWIGDRIHQKGIHARFAHVMAGDVSGIAAITPPDCVVSARQTAKSAVAASIAAIPRVSPSFRGTNGAASTANVCVA